MKPMEKNKIKVKSDSSLNDLLGLSPKLVKTKSNIFTAKLEVYYVFLLIYDCTE